MSQTEILRYLRRKKKPVDMQELIVKLPCNRASISRNCKKLRERNEVKYIKKREKSYEKFYYFL